MDWIKKHYDQFALVLAALALVVLSGLIILRSRSFPETFTEANTTVVPSEKVPELDLKTLKSAQALLDQPVKWSPKSEANEFLFVPNLYMIDKDGVPRSPIDGFLYNDSLTGKPIPNKFFVTNKLPLLDKSSPSHDADKDGFTNEDEWRGEREPKDTTKWAGSTDPNDPKSHPKYITKLFLKQWIPVPFRLLFQAADGDPKKPEGMTFQINAIDRGRRTEFLKIGEKVGGSNLKIEKYEPKNIVNPSTGAETDVSELTLQNTETKENIVLVIGKQGDSPDSYALFDYQWNNEPIKVKKLGEFVLKPETDKRYKLIDIKAGEALITLPDGSEYIVIPDPRAKK